MFKESILTTIGETYLHLNEKSINLSFWTFEIINKST